MLSSGTTTATVSTATTTDKLHFLFGWVSLLLMHPASKCQVDNVSVGAVTASGLFIFVFVGSSV